MVALIAPAAGGILTSQYPEQPPYGGPQQYGRPQPYQGQQPPNPYGYPPPPQQPQWGPPPPYYVMPVQNRSNGLGVAGFVTGLLGLVFFWFPIVGLILALLGIILGGSGIAVGRRDNSGTGLAIAGLVCGIVAMIPAIIIIAAISSTT
jgi:hypothetical protein